jgi:hypothetical protein
MSLGSVDVGSVGDTEVDAPAAPAVRRELRQTAERRSRTAEQTRAALNAEPASQSSEEARDVALAGLRRENADKSDRRVVDDALRRRNVGRAPVVEAERYSSDEFEVARALDFAGEEEDAGEERDQDYTPRPPRKAATKKASSRRRAEAKTRDAEAKGRDEKDAEEEEGLLQHRVGRRDRPLISAPAGRYALRAFARLQEQWAAGDRLDFPVSRPCCYLVMREETRGKRTDYIGMSTRVLKRWQDHQTHKKRGSKDLSNRSGASLLWPVAVVTGFSSDRGKAKKYALLFESMWQKPGKRIDPNDKTVGWDVRQRKWSDPDTGKIKPLDARDGLERLRARRVCPDPSQCWGDTVHTIAVLLRHPLWRPLKLTLYIFHPSFALCYNHALRALTDEDEFNPLPNVRVLGFWPARINRKLELLLAEGDDRARARDNEDEDAEDDGGARASAGDGEDRQ